MANHYAQFPNISLRRNEIDNPFRHQLSFNFGTLNVIDCKEVLPGQTDVLDLSSYIRMSTPIAPIMDDIKIHIHAYYVPMRLLWSHTEEFYGANKTSAGPQPNTYYIPQRSIFKDGVPTGSISHQLGKPYCVADANKTNYGMASVLKERGYYLIATEWYRNQQVQNPIIVATDDSDDIATINGVAVTRTGMPLKVNKHFDLFTTATLYAQYSVNGVTLPLGASAPVFAGNVNANLPAYNIMKFVKNDGTAIGGNYNVAVDANGQLVNGSTSSAGVSFGLTPNNLYADLTQATAASLNSLYFAAAMQNYLYRANFGSRFFEMLAVHYGVTSPDARLQRPEYIGGTSFYLNIDQVLSTAGYSPDDTSSLGAPGASSVTGKVSSLFTKGYVEPGYVYVLISSSQRETYSQGLLKEDTKKDRFEFFAPEFAALGDDYIKNEELFVSGTSTDSLAFGYAEHWYEYKTRLDRVSGILDPAVPNSLDYWTLANKFNSTPSLDEDFITRNRDNISRVLVTGSEGPDFIADFLCRYKEYKSVPIYAQPGFVRGFRF